MDCELVHVGPWWLLSLISSNDPVFAPGVRPIVDIIEIIDIFDIMIAPPSLLAPSSRKNMFAPMLNPARRMYAAVATNVR
jgi:hypothetical protein